MCRPQAAKSRFGCCLQKPQRSKQREIFINTNMVLMFLLCSLWEKGNVCSILYEHISYSCVKYRVWDVFCTTPTCDRVLNSCRRSPFYLWPHLLVHRALDQTSIRPVAQFLCNLAKLSFFLPQERLRASLHPTESISEQLKDVLLVSLLLRTWL